MKTMYYISRALCCGGPWKEWTVRGWQKYYNEHEELVLLDTERDAYLLVDALKLRYRGVAIWNVESADYHKDPVNGSSLFYSHETRKEG